MATEAQCRQALQGLADRLEELDPELRRKHAVDRTLACTIPDLGITFTGRIHDGSLLEVAEHRTDPGPDAQIRVQVASDDLLDLVEGRTALAHAWARGKLRVDASVLDLFRLRSFI